MPSPNLLTLALLACLAAFSIAAPVPQQDVPVGDPAVPPPNDGPLEATNGCQPGWEPVNPQGDCVPSSGPPNGGQVDPQTWNGQAPAAPAPAPDAYVSLYLVTSSLIFKRLMSFITDDLRPALPNKFGVDLPNKGQGGFVPNNVAANQAAHPFGAPQEGN